MRQVVDEQSQLEAELQRAAAISKAISHLSLAGDVLLQAATGDDAYEQALRQAGAAHYRAKIAALSNEIEMITATWESVPDLEKRARVLGLLI